MRPFLLLTMGLAACTSPGKVGDDSAASPGASAADSGEPVNEVDPSELNGEQPDEPLPAPEFAARNRDGAARDREDLLGHPTVMWFYPAAATAG